MPPENKNEPEIWDSFRMGNVEAFLLIRQRYVKKLYRYGYKTTGIAAIAKEVAIDFFVDLWIKRESLGATPSPRNYLYLAYRRRLYIKIEKEKRYADLEPLAENLPDNDELSAEELIIRTEDSEKLEMKVKNAMSALTRRQREAIHLKFFENMSYQEIAEIMELNSQSAYNLIHRALTTLRQIITKMPEEGMRLKMFALIYLWTRI